jgi:hypothetical protein
VLEEKESGCGVNLKVVHCILQIGKTAVKADEMDTFEPVVASIASERDHVSFGVAPTGIREGGKVAGGRG